MHVKLHFKLAGETSGQMSIVIIMAVILEEELRERGIRGLTQLDRETSVHSMIERTAALEADRKQRHLGSRLDDQN